MDLLDKDLFAITNAAQAREKWDFGKQCLEELFAIEKINFCFTLDELFKTNPKIEKIRLAVVISSYDDNGLYEGAYFDYVAPGQDEFMNQYEDFRNSYEFSEKMNDNRYKQFILAINEVAEKSSTNLQQDLEGVVFGKDLESNILMLCGQELTQKWKSCSVAESINKTIRKPTTQRVSLDKPKV